MATLTQSKRTRRLEERYEMLRKTLAHYLLLQVGTFVTAAGFDAIAPAMNILTDMKANLKVQDIKSKGQGSRVEALSRTWLIAWARPSIATMRLKRKMGPGRSGW